MKDGITGGKEGCSDEERQIEKEWRRVNKTVIPDARADPEELLEGMRERTPLSSCLQSQLHCVSGVSPDTALLTHCASHPQLILSNCLNGNEFMKEKAV